jgi:hypothetical protein
MPAGIPVRRDLVPEVADLVDEPTASVLEHALDREIAVVALTIEDRERNLRAFDDPPTGLEEISSILASTSGGVREGLV